MIYGIVDANDKITCVGCFGATCHVLGVYVMTTCVHDNECIPAIVTGLLLNNRHENV